MERREIKNWRCSRHTRQASLIVHISGNEGIDNHDGRCESDGIVLGGG